MKPTRPTPAKIVNHSGGLGTPTPDIIRQRARELASINGHENYNEEDWRQAKREMHGGHPDQNGDDNEMMECSSLGDPAVGSVGHRVEPLYDDADEHIAEELIAEEIDKAMHERMLEAFSEITRMIPRNNPPASACGKLVIRHFALVVFHAPLLLEACLRISSTKPSRRRTRRSTFRCGRRCSANSPGRRKSASGWN